MPDAANALESEGCVWFRGALSETKLRALDPICALGSAPGARIAPAPDLIAALAPVDRLAQSLLAGARPVRVVAFNKTEAANWALPWHQDRVIAVRERVETPGFVNWTRKSGVWHVEPPIGLLERMLFLRVHLDAADVESACLVVATGSHSRGKVPDDRAEGIASAAVTEQCIAQRGDVLAAKALILHRSGASRRPTSRRAIRIDYSAEQLQAPLQWEFST
ncbi:MAG: phytanoyl-CoA dioxygenase family protein [Hyphomonadaceae bacterium]|nr:phytanoyl-CoA dioxygenase family protein [Hyphomonadaceae bacterium]